jgi:hypothetical protein
MGTLQLVKDTFGFIAQSNSVFKNLWIHDATDSGVHHVHSTDEFDAL